MASVRPVSAIVNWPLGWRETLAIAGLLLLLAAGLVGYGGQLTTGLAVTGLNGRAYWGLYIANFVFFIGLSAGGIIVASLVHAFRVEEFRPVARIAELMAIACLLLAMMFILLDLGRPDRMFFLFRHGRPQSPLIWDVTVVNSYLLIGLAYAYFGLRADLVRAGETTPRRRWLYRVLTLGHTDLSPRALARDHRILRVLAMVGLVAAVALHTVTAWILGLMKARPGWYGAIMAPLFIVSATVSGLALLLVSVVFSRRVLGLPIEARVVRRLGQLLAFTIPVLGYFLFAELLTVLYAREPAGVRVFEEMMFGRYALVFWANLVLGLIVPLALLATTLLEVPRRVWLPVTAIGGVVLTAAATVLVPRVPASLAGSLAAVGGPAVPAWGISFLVWAILVVPILVLLALPLRADTRIATAALLVVLGVLAERWNIVVPPLIGYAHLPYPPGHYVPTLNELVIVGGVYAVGGLLFAFAARFLPLLEHE